MLRITLPLSDATTWGDLRKYVELNHAAGDHEAIGFDIDTWNDDQIVGLTEVVPSREVLPRGE